MLQQLFALNTLKDFAYALTITISFMVMLFTLRKWLIIHLERVAKKTDTLIDDFLIEVLAGTRILLASASGLFLGSLFLTLPTAIQTLVNRAFGAALIIQIGFWATRGLIFWLRHHFSKGNKDEEGARAMTQSLLEFLGRVAIWVIVLLMMMDNMGINVTALVASLGIGGIAIALAVQNILGDLFASLSIAIDKPFVIGDFIILGDEMGTVEHVGLKTTRIRSLGGEQIILSNNDLLKSRIRNFKRMQERRIIFTIGVTYDTSAEKLEQIPILIQRAVEAQSCVRFDRSHFKCLSAFSLDFETVYFVLKSDYTTYMDVQQSINLALIRAFKDKGIIFAFPTQTLHLQEYAASGNGKQTSSVTIA